MIKNSARVIFLFVIACLHSCSGDKSAREHVTPVFTREIAPILYANCSPCHRPGSGAPFNLITYEDIRHRLKTLQLAINTRLMPPWPADTSYSRFIGEKVLTQEEINLLNEWFDAGGPEGNPADLPPPPEFTETSIHAKPDLVLQIRNPVMLPGDNKDKFLMLKIPFELPADTFIRAIEIVPGNKKLVHHINAHLVQYDSGKKKDHTRGKSYVDTELHDKRESFELLDLPNDDGSYPLLTPSVSNYLPGVEVCFYPEGIGGYRVKKQSVLLLDNIHYGPTPVDTTDQTTFHVYFDKQPPKRPVREFILGTSGISPVMPPLVVPPDTIMKFVTSYRLPESISLITVNPHMHLLGSSFKAYAIPPSGDTIPIVRIPQWDFRWQYFYTFPKMMKLVAGTVMVVEGVYDNTVNNPLNPFYPPRTVAERDGSMRTTDEMFQLICTYLPYREGDEYIPLRPDEIIIP